MFIKVSCEFNSFLDIYFESVDSLLHNHKIKPSDIHYIDSLQKGYFF